MNKFVSDLLTKFGRGEGLTPHCISWNIAPKINAVFREGDITKQTQLLASFCGLVDPEPTLKMLSSAHRNQSEKVREIYESMQQSLIINENSVIGFIDSGDSSLTGLLAVRLMTAYNRPGFVLRKMTDPTRYSGSCRSPMPILDLVNQSKYMTGRGHDSAFGVMVKAANIEKFCKWLDKQDIGVYNEKQVTAIITPEQISLGLCRAIDGHQYLFGNDLKTPSFYVEFDVAKEASGHCLCGKANNTFRIMPFIKFGCKPHEVEALSTDNDKHICAVVELTVNEFDGNQYPQARIVDWEINQIESKVPEFDFDSLFQ